MDSIIREYIVKSKADGAKQLDRLKDAGCNVSAVTQTTDTYYLYVWSDGTVTGDEVKSEMTELFADTFQSITI